MYTTLLYKKILKNLHTNLDKVKIYIRNVNMSEQNRQQKNHWTSVKIDDAAKKINRDIYKRNRQAPIHIKLDDLAQIGNT